MKNAPFEPDGRLRRQSVLPLQKFVTPQVYPAEQPSTERFRSVEHMVRETRPELPVHCLRPTTIGNAARRFMKLFPGDTLFAVKTNPDPLVIGYLAAAGVLHYDVASIAEVKLVADLVPDAKLYFMHPVKSRAAIAAAYFEYGVRDFSLDTHEELQKIMEVTGNADDLNLYVRVIVPNDTAYLSLAGKFGVTPEEAPALLQATRAAANRMGVCFHVGSQCMEPEAYSVAIHKVAEMLDASGVHIDVLDIGGGFPSIYPGIMPLPLTHYMKAIKKALAATQAQFGHCQLIAEPGRALVAEGGSVVVRVELRKGNALYINDGTYGSLFDAGVPGFVYPVKAMRPGGKLSAEVQEFTFYGPTCDSMDAMKGPFHLPKDIQEGDWIEVGQLGSYGKTMRTDFNGFGETKTVEVSDKPLLNRAAVN
jgi:ornithine decarboxylase